MLCSVAAEYRRFGEPRRLPSLGPLPSKHGTLRMLRSVHPPSTDGALLSIPNPDLF
jgi:hypothetical protein